MRGWVLYRMPRSNVFYYKTGECKHYNTIPSDISGFIFAPFIIGESYPVILLSPQTETILLREELHQLDLAPKVEVVVNEYFTGKEEYEKQVDHLVEMLGCDMKKVVLSRIAKSDNIDITKTLEVYQKLEENFPNAFVYLTSLPGAGVWVGASPEIFLTEIRGEYSTVALAGTQLVAGLDKSATWSKKELNEQHLVELFVEEQLNNIAAKAITKLGPSTIMAGRLAHLKTIYSFQIEKSQQNELIALLHPTPAVCGLPKAKGYEAILNTEKHSRAYYTGFLGLINRKYGTHLFVNLRCMQLLDNYALLFAGGGITKASIPENEWIETENKINSINTIFE